MTNIEEKMITDTTLASLRSRLLDANWTWAEGEALLTVGQSCALRSESTLRFKNEVVPMLVRVIQASIKRGGWLFPPCRQDPQEVMHKVRERAQEAVEADHYTSLSRTGVAFLRAHSRSFWSTQGGAIETCMSAYRLAPIVAYRVGLNKSNEVWDLTPEVLRRGLISGRKVPSFFKPVTAAALYLAHLGDNPDPVVWDPCAGFGARMLGFFSAYPQGTYIANEPAKMTREDLMALGNGLGPRAKGVASRGQYRIRATGCEVEGPTQPVDMVLTSPPYHDLERYFDEPGQCWKDYPEANEWRRRFFFPMVHRAADALRPGGALVLNVDEKRSELAQQAAAAAGLVPGDHKRLDLGADHFARARGEGPRSEPILVFTKQSSKCVVSLAQTNGRYSIGNDGTVTSYTRSWVGQEIQGSTLSSGYQAVGVTEEKGGPSSTRLVHRLVCQTFHGDPPTPEHTDVRHLNGDKQDNRACNLAWGTRSENMRDVVTHRREGPDATPETSPNTETWYQGRTGDSELVKVCVALVHEKKIEVNDVARLLDCSRTVASNLVTGRSQAHLTKNVRTQKRKRRTPAQRQAIRDMIVEGSDLEAVNKALDEALTHQDFYYYKKTATAS